MKKLITLAFVFLVINASAQLDKGVWLVGGTGSLLASKVEYTIPAMSYVYNADRLNISVSPNIGYFIVDKFALGLKTNYTKSKEQGNGLGGGYSNENRFSLGPFARYYFLNKDKQYNILSELSYQYGFYWFKPNKGNSNTFNIAAGSAVYFNSSVGLEFLVGYYSTKETIRVNADKNISKQNGMQVSIGFQIHLQK